MIIRTAAPYSNRKQKIAEIESLRKLYANIYKEFQTANVGTLLYSDDSLPLRILRDILSQDVEEVIVGTHQIFDEVNGFMLLHPEEKRRPITLHDTGRDMFHECGINKQIDTLMTPRVELENGAYLIIEKTEALTVIDVNTGKFIGDDSLEQTVYYTNILAAREIARQVRLRNVGGIVVVDFIDMENPNHRKSLTDELEKALSTDKAKCTVLPMSKFGLIEFTRKRIGTNPLSFMTKPCKYCREAGYTKSVRFILLDLRAQLLDLLAEGNNTVCIDLNYEVGNQFMEWTDMVDDIRHHYSDARVYLVLHRTYHEEKFAFRCDRGSVFTLPEGYVQLY